MKAAEPSHGEMYTMRAKRGTVLSILILVAATTLAVCETKKEFRFKVGPKSSVSITNQYGPISVTPSGNDEVVVTAVLHSDKVEVDQDRAGNRVDIISHLLPGANADSGRIDYEVTVPADASLTLHSTTGPLRAEKLHGDLSLEAATGSIEVREISDAHVHINTLKGPVTLTNIDNGHVEVTSVSGDVTLISVVGPKVQVNSNSGKIRYDGDFGSSGQYSFTSHTGDIDAIAPAYASIDVTASSVKGKLQDDFPLTPKHAPFNVKGANALTGTVNKATSSVKLLSFGGRIRLSTKR